MPLLSAYRERERDGKLSSAVETKMQLWVVGRPTTKKEEPKIPLLRRGGSREATDGVVGYAPAHAKKTTPSAPPTPLLRRGISRPRIVQCQAAWFLILIAP